MQTKEKNEEIEIDLGDLFGALLHYAWIIIISTIVFAAVGFALSKFVMTPMYKSTTGIYIMSKQNSSSAVTYSDTQLATQLTKDYEELITCRTVLENVIRELGLSDSYGSLKGRVAVQNTNNTRIIYITVTDPDPVMAQKTANSIREVASKHITTVTDTEAVTVVDEANLPKSPSEPSAKKWTMLLGLVGFVASAGIIIIRFLLDDSVKTAEDVENYLGLSTLALIPVMEVIDDDGNKEKRARKKPQHSSHSHSAGSSGNSSGKGSGSMNRSSGGFSTDTSASRPTSNAPAPRRVAPQKQDIDAAAANAIGAAASGAAAENAAVGNTAAGNTAGSVASAGNDAAPQRPAPVRRVARQIKPDINSGIEEINLDEYDE